MGDYDDSIGKIKARHHTSRLSEGHGYNKIAASSQIQPHGIVRNRTGHGYVCGVRACLSVHSPCLVVSSSLTLLSLSVIFLEMFSLAWLAASLCLFSRLCFFLRCSRASVLPGARRLESGIEELCAYTTGTGPWKSGITILILCSRERVQL